MKIVSTPTIIEKKIKTRIQMSERDIKWVVENISREYNRRSVEVSCHYFGITLEQYYYYCKQLGYSKYGLNNLFGSKNFCLNPYGKHPEINVSIKNKEVIIKPIVLCTNLGTLTFNSKYSNIKDIIFNFLSNLTTDSKINKIVDYINEVNLKFEKYENYFD